MRPLDALEHLALGRNGGACATPEIFHDTPVLREDSALAQDVILLMRAVALVDALVPNELREEFAHALSRLKSPDLVIMV